MPVSLTNVVVVEAGNLHSLALRSNGTVVAWGYNDYGACNIPADLTNATAVKGGAYHSLALRSDGTVTVWGSYNNGNYVPAYVPAGLSNVVAIAAGGNHDLALRSDGTVEIWGETILPSSPPEGLSNVVAIAAGSGQNLALQADGNLVSWGSGAVTYYPPPSGLTNIASISARYFNFAARRTDGTVVVWGSDFGGQNTLPGSLSNNVAKIEVGTGFLLAVTEEGRVVVWGEDYFNRLNVPPFGPVARSISGGEHGMVLLEDHPPSIVRQPLTQTLFSGNAVSFGISVFGSRAMSYQWRFENSAIPQATNATYTIPFTMGTNSGSYSVVVSNFLGSVTSAPALLTVNEAAPVISAQPTNQIGYWWLTNTFEVAASGSSPLTYQWRLQGTNLPGATNSKLSFFINDLALGGNYSVVVSNPFGSVTSSVATLTIIFSAPSIPVQPAHQIGYLGRSNTFAVTADGSIPLSYQWQFMGTNLPGATNSNLTLQPVKKSDEGDYSVIVSNHFGAATSSNTHLAVPTVVGWGRATSGQNDPPAEATNIVELAEGNGHSLARRSNGLVLGWGNNADGESIIPPGASNAVKIAAGGKHSLALKSDGSVVGWGNNCCGQLTIPSDATNLVDIAAGTNFSVGLRVDGTLLTWGAVSTPSFSNIMAVAAGANHGLALHNHGVVSAWGSNNFGQLNVPVSATNLVAISAGESHSVALNTAGRVFAWGNNSFGQTNIPTSVTNIVAVQAGRYHNFALRADGAFLSWGSNTSGERNIPAVVTNLAAFVAGDGHSAASIEPPGPPRLDGATRAIAASAGMGFILNAAATGTLPFAYQWQLNGTNIAGATNRTFQLGNVQAAQSGNYTVVVTNSLGFASNTIAIITVNPSAPNITLQPASQERPLGSAATFTVGAAGTDPLSYQWRFQSSAILSATNSSLTISNLNFANAGVYQVIVSNAVGSTTSIVATLQIARAYLWGNTSNSRTNPPSTATNLIALTAGADHSLALRADGAVVGWGLNSSGQTNPPASASNVIAIAAGYDHNLVMRGDGALVAWGNSVNSKTTIPAAATNTPFFAIAAGSGHNLVLRTNGSVFAWGVNSFGITNVPTQATGVIRISAGNKSATISHSLALRRDGSVISWGYNNGGQTNTPSSATNIVAVAGGSDFSLGLKADGTVMGWGANGSGQITIPATATNVVAIAAGGTHSLALRSDGSIVGWGNNSFGQRTIPATVSNSTSVAITAGNTHSGCLLSDGSPVFVDSLGALVAYSNRVFTLNALAVGAPPLSYQWQFNGVDIPAANAGKLTLPSVQSTNAGLYSVVVSNSFGVVSGIVANVSVEIAPELPSAQVPPASQTVFAGTNVVFSVVAGGYPAPSYRWQFFNTNLPFATNASYTIPYALTNHAGNYRVVLSNSVGVVTSQVATLTVNTPDWAVIRSWPTNRAVPYGSPVTLTVAPYNAGPVTYGWQLNGTNIPHVGGPSLNFTSFTPSVGGVYRVTASNQFGGSISPEFEIAAVPVAVWGSGSVTSLPLALTNAVTLGAGVQHAAALKADGQVVAWGDNVVITSGPSTTNNYGMATTPAGLSNVSGIAVGTYHNVAVRSDGTVIAWGRNTGGQTNVPATATNVIAVAAGDYHSLALRGDGTVIAWGTNTSGQLNVPLDATNIVAIAAGSAHSLALRGDGRLVAWGSSSAIQPMPTTVNNAIAISARGSYCIAIRQDGTKVVWGNSTPTLSPFGVFNPGFPYDHVSASAGFSHGLFLHAGGSVEALYSFSISGSDARLITPTWLGNVVSVAAGNASFALMRPSHGLPLLQVSQRHAHIGSSAVFSTHVEGQQTFNSSTLTGYQWRFNGTNISGATNSFLVLSAVTAQQAGGYSVVAKDYTGSVTSQVASLTVSPPPLPQIATQPLSRTVGAGTNVTLSTALAYGIPGQIQWQFNGADLPGVTGSSLTLSNVQSINTGDYRVIVTNMSGSITSQVATLTVTSAPPVFLVQPTSRNVSEGFSTTLSAQAIGTDPISYQWSLNDVEIPGATASTFTISNASAIAMGTYRVVATNSVGSITSSPAIVTLVPLTVWIGNPAALTNAPASTTNAIALAAGSAHALALLATGGVAAWGDNTCGQTSVPGSAVNVVRVAAGELHSLALKDDGTILAWGNNFVGQSSVPAGLSNVVEIAAGLMHNVALRADGTVVSWGWNFGGVTNPPAGLSNVVAIAAGGMQSLALKQDGTLAVWGTLDHVPDSATNVIGIAVGYGHCVALQSNGNVIAWGSTSTNSGLNISFGCSGYSVSGSLAVKTNLIPTPANATNIVAIAAGRHHIVALRADGELIAWGDNSAGQLNAPVGTGVTGIAAGKYQTLALLGSSSPQLGGFRTNRFAGETATVLLNTTASGRPPLTWEWQLGSTNAAGSNRTFVAFPSAFTNDSGHRAFVVSNPFGSVTGNITLTVTAQPPVVVTQPVGLLTGVGSNVTFTSGATGSLPLNYQWRRDGVPLTDGGSVSGANTTVLTLQNVQLADTGNYSLAVTNHAGFAISTNAAMLVFDESPLASALDTTGLVWTTGGSSGWHWQTATNHDGVDAAEAGPLLQESPVTERTNWLETTITGPVTISFWWRAYGWIADVISFSVDGVDRVGIQLLSDLDWQQRTYFVPAGQHALRWTYRSRAFAGTSTAWLDQITFTNATAPTITTQPTSRTATVGSSTTFSTAASGTDPFAYQWLVNGLELPNATNASLTLNNIELTNAGNYQVVVTNIASTVTSSVAVLTVNGSLPILQTGPTSFTAATSTSPTLNSSFIGSTPIGIQWQLNGMDIPGGTGLSLVLTNLQPHQAGLYRVVASNEFGTTISAEAQVTIVPVAAWGEDIYGQTRVPSWIGDVVGITAGESHGTALLRDGTVTTWGVASLSSPTQFPTGADRFTSIVGAERHILGLRTNGTVLPFGYIGVGLSNVPPGLSNVVAVATGGRHDLALRSDGSVVAWGTNVFSQTTIPATATNLVAVAAGLNFSLGVTDTGELIAWGTNSHGQLDLPGTSDFVAVAAGHYHALALRENGTVVAWGNNASTQTSVPTGLSNIVSIAAGESHSLALRGDGKVFAWGSNTDGQSTVWDTLTNATAIACGSSHSLALVGDGRPVITLPPQRRRLEPGGNTTLSVFVTGASPLGYQWKHDGTNIPGATNATLLTSLVGNYSVTVSNSLGTTDSSVAKVLLTKPVLRFDTSTGAMFLAADGLHLRLMGLSGKGPVVVLASTDFASWTPILTNAPVIGQFSFVDSSATNLVSRFYRAVETEMPPIPALRLISPSWTQTPTGSLFRATVTGLIGSGPAAVFGSANLTNWNLLITNPPASVDWQFNHLQTNAPTLYWYRAAEER